MAYIYEPRLISGPADGVARSASRCTVEAASRCRLIVAWSLITSETWPSILQVAFWRVLLQLQALLTLNIDIRRTWYRYTE